jgi:trimeric autotransporter adhesin
MACSTTLLALTITLAAASVCASLGLRPNPLWLTVAFSGAAAAGRQALLLCAAFDRAPAQYCAEERVVRAARQTGPTTVATATAAAGALALAAVLAPRELRALRELCIFAGCVTVLLGVGGSFFGYAALLVSARAGERALAKAAKAANTTATTTATAAANSSATGATSSANNGTKKGWCGFSKLRKAKPPVCVTVNSSPVGSPRSPQYSVTSPLMFRSSPTAAAAATAASSAAAASASVAVGSDSDTDNPGAVAAHSRPWSLSTPVLSSGSSSVHTTDASTAAAAGASGAGVRCDSSHSSSGIKLSMKPLSPGVTSPPAQPLLGRIAAVITGRWYLRLPLLLVMLAVAAAAAWTVCTSPQFPVASRTTLLSTQTPLAGYLTNAKALGLLQGESFERATLYISGATAANTSFLSSAAAQAEVQRLEAALWGLSPAQPPADSWLQLFKAWCSAGAVSCTGDGFTPALHNFLADSSASGGARFVYNFHNSSSSSAVAATRVTWWHGKRSADTVAAARAVAASSTTLSAVVDAPSWAEVDIAHMATMQVCNSTINSSNTQHACS